jgi:glycosyltransferase involved in cell wall biosynthesis
MQVSVIIPAYNSAATLAAAIDSVLAQRGCPAEIVVVDDGSTDSTPELLKTFSQSVKVVRQRNAGAAAARNSGVAAATGEYLAFLDADDTWLPGRLQLTIGALEHNTKAVLSFSDYLIADSSGEVFDRSRAGRAPSHQDLLRCAWPILPSAVTVRRSAYEQVGGFCAEFKGCGGDDPYMWLLMSESGPFEYVPEALMVYRSATPGTIIEKYEPGLKTFERLVRSRYGETAQGCIRESHNYFAAMSLAGALEDLDRGDLRRAMHLMRRALRYRPLLFFAPELMRKVIGLRNAKRIFNVLFRRRLHAATGE